MLIATGIVGGGTVPVSLSWLQPLGFALIGLGAAGLVWSRIRACRGGCGAGSVDGACGACASPGCGCATAAAGAGKSGIEDRRS
ncbi:hypothetical protein AB0I35_32180 [Nocardia sp. NPDC050378]|uniref:hypothetical protein n=1 Tax=Nocardia sp. NPDC050378 TaxID=3155400 RepID=UPI0033F837F3